jgi:dTDP-4-dehydrorhamnose reductase
MRLLVLGSNGLVGSALMRVALDRGLDVAGTYHSEPPAFDVPLEHLALEEWPPDEFGLGEFDAVANCAAMTDVDGCERNPDQAMTINGSAPGKIADGCRRHDVTFVHFSTDYVFDGMTNVLYAEEDDPAPRQVYGKSKLRGERTVRDVYDGALILRLSFVYGIHGGTGELEGFPAWVVEMLEDAESVPLFTDQHVTPSRAGQVAATTLALLEGNHCGTYHVACRSCVTPYSFGQRLVNELGLDPDPIEPGTMAAVDRPASRPVNTCLSTDRLSETVDRPQPTLDEEIARITDAFC